MVLINTNNNIITNNSKFCLTFDKKEADVLLRQARMDISTFLNGKCLKNDFQYKNCMAEYAEKILKYTVQNNSKFRSMNYCQYYIENVSLLKTYLANTHLFGLSNQPHIL